MAEEIQIGVIGGSGLYQMAEIQDISRQPVSTPFGDPSNDLILGTLRGKRIAFLPRHGEGHIYSPEAIPHRANIYALKSVGVRMIISVNACGSLREDFKPGDVVVPDQLIDYTIGKRDRSFFNHGIVAHVSVADPFSEVLRQHLIHAVHAENGTVHAEGSFLIEDGPRFATRGESLLFQQWGCDIIGMTTAPEAFLAREAEIAYATMAHITDYDTWHEEPVTVEMVVATFNKNIDLAQRVLAHTVEHLDPTLQLPAHTALDGAIMTARDRIPASEIEKLHPIVSRALGL